VNISFLQFMDGLQQDFKSFREEVSCCEVTFCAVTLLPLGLNAVENKALVGSIASVLPRGIRTAR